MTRPIITVDGLASSGKSTLARLLAARLGYAHLNSGLLYRGVAWLALAEGISPEDEHSLLRLIGSHEVALIRGSQGESCLCIDGRVADARELQAPKVSEATSRLSVHPAVRQILVPHQQNAFLGEGVVAEGRDMGTVIFPAAQLKFFVTADEQVRIQRRISQLHSAQPHPGGLPPEGPDSANRLKKEVEIEILERDKRDRERAIAPTVAAHDAVSIDNSADSLTQIVDRMYSIALSRGLTPSSKKKEA